MGLGRRLLPAGRVSDDLLVWCPTCEAPRPVEVEVLDVMVLESEKPIKQIERRRCEGCGGWVP